MVDDALYTVHCPCCCMHWTHWTQAVAFHLRKWSEPETGGLMVGILLRHSQSTARRGARNSGQRILKWSSPTISGGAEHFEVLRQPRQNKINIDQKGDFVAAVSEPSPQAHYTDDGKTRRSCRDNARTCLAPGPPACRTPSHHQDPGHSATNLWTAEGQHRNNPPFAATGGGRTFARRQFRQGKISPPLKSPKLQVPCTQMTATEQQKMHETESPRLQHIATVFQDEPNTPTNVPEPTVSCAASYSFVIAHGPSQETQCLQLW